MELKENIEKQIMAGFTKEEIYESLKSNGYSTNEIDECFKANAKELKANSKTNTKSILFGSLFLIIVIFRIIRYSSTNSSSIGSTLGLISIFTGLLLAILYFAKKI